MFNIRIPSYWRRRRDAAVKLAVDLSVVQNANGSETLCSWPPYQSATRTSQAIASMIAPSPGWTEFEAVIIRICDTLIKARQVCAQYCIDSDVPASASENEMKKSRKLRKAVHHHSDNDVENDGQPAKKLTVKKPVQVLLELQNLPPPPIPLQHISTQHMETVEPTDLMIPSDMTHIPNDSIPCTPCRPPPEFLLSQTNVSELSSEQSPDNDPVLESLPSAETMSRLATTSAARVTGMSVVDRRVLLLLEEIKSQNQTQIILLQQLVSSRTAAHEGFDCQDEFGLPITSLQQLLKLESDCQDRDLKAKLLRFLALSGGSAVADTSRNIMKRLMLSSVAAQCNWRGKGGKHAFGTGVIKQIVCDAVRRNPATCRAVDTEIEKAIKDWLRFASDRDGGRQRRATRKLASNNQATPLKN